MEQFKITKPVRLIELFSGIGAQSMALKKLKVSFEMWKTSDIDINAVKSYKAIHCSNDNTDYSEGLFKMELVAKLYEMAVSSDGKNPMKLEQLQHKNETWLRETYNNFMATHNLGSVIGVHAKDLEIDEKKYINILTYSFPCTDLSLAGLQKGMDRNSGTASSLLWQVERILKECKDLECLPGILVMENVTQVHGSKNLENWNLWLKTLEDLGYNNFYSDLNAKDYGIPQNRNRCFMISLLSDKSYTFPNPIKLQFRMKDFLETEVDEKYYIDNEKAKKLIKELEESGKLNKSQTAISMTGICNHNWDVSGKPIDVAHTLMARDWKGPSTYSFNGVVENE